jgi:hypothetical protein
MLVVIAPRWYGNAFQGLEQGCTNRGFQIAVTTKFFWWRLMFADPQYGTYFVSLFWRLQFEVVSRFWKLCAPLH